MLSVVSDPLPDPVLLLVVPLPLLLLPQAPTAIVSAATPLTATSAWRQRIRESLPGLLELSAVLILLLPCVHRSAPSLSAMHSTRIPQIGGTNCRIEACRQQAAQACRTASIKVLCAPAWTLCYVLGNELE